MTPFALSRNEVAPAFVTVTELALKPPKLPPLPFLMIRTPAVTPLPLQAIVPALDPTKLGDQLQLKPAFSCADAGWAATTPAPTATTRIPAAAIDLRIFDFTFMFKSLSLLMSLPSICFGFTVCQTQNKTVKMTQ
jgi:hypothetical protein